MKFAELLTGDWFEWNGRAYIRLKDTIMSLDKRDFGTLYTPLLGNREVKYITAFDYQVKPPYADCGNNEISIKGAPIEVLLEHPFTGSFYVKISPYDPNDPDLVVIRTQGDNQGSLYYSRFLNAKVCIVDTIHLQNYE